jgi:hypothetical protein
VPRVAALVLLLTACAARQPVEPLRIVATHYQSMSGVPVGQGDDAMTCSREAITGSHILRWYCRTSGESPQYELGGPVRFVLR